MRNNMNIEEEEKRITDEKTHEETEKYKNQKKNRTRRRENEEKHSHCLYCLYCRSWTNSPF